MTTLLSASDGSLDTSFGVNGLFMDPNTTTSASGQYIQVDGKIVVVGNSTVSLAQVITIYRLTSTGTLDSTFGVGGTVTLAQQQSGSMDTADGVAVQSDGKIVVVGYSGSTADTLSHVVVARLNSNGSLDSTFGTGGIVLLPYLGSGGSFLFGDQAYAVVIQTDGKIVAVGTSDSGTVNPHFMIIRLTTTGSLDTTFNHTGFVITDFSGNGSSSDVANAVAFQSNNAIIAAGSSTALNATSHFALARYNANGSPDTTFNGTGLVITNFDPIGNTSSETAYAVNIQPNGSIIAAGSSVTPSTNPANLARYLSDGSLDSSFFGGTATVPGTVVTSAGSENTNEYYALALQADGKIVAAGAHQGASSPFSFMIGRYQTTGALDTSFNGGGAPLGLVYTSFGNDFTSAQDFAVSLQNNGLIVGSGTFLGTDISQFVAARYLDATPLTSLTITSPTSFSKTSTPTFTGVAQNPSIIDIFVDGTLFVSTVTSGSSNSWSVVAPSPLSLGAHTLQVVERYHDDGHVNVQATITFTVVQCNSGLVDAYSNLYDGLYPC
jgi:uncharacterized delta-60 repeat protein